MKVKCLNVENLLSFDKFELNLNEKMNVIVGPNGAGKSNIVRIFDLVCKALDWALPSSYVPLQQSEAGQVLSLFAAARHYGSSPERPAIVRLEFEFTMPKEQELLCTFVRASILSTLLGELRFHSNDENAAAVSRWVETEITNVKLSPLCSGAVLLEHNGLPDQPWDISYEFSYQNVSYRWLISPSNFASVIVPASSIPYRGNQIGDKRLMEALFKLASSDQPVQLPDLLPSFDFSSLCPGNDRPIGPILIQTGAGSFDTDFTPFRRAVELLNIPGKDNVSQRSFPLSYVLLLLLEDGIITLGEQFRGLGIGGTPPQQSGPYPWEVLISPLRSRSPWLLPLRLFELKNGSQADRIRFQEIQKTFTELAPGRSIDVKFEAFDRNTMNPTAIGTGQVVAYSASNSRQDQQNLLVTPQPGAAITIVVDREKGNDRHPDDIPIQLHGGGTWESLVIAEALVESRDRFVIYDEPALTLHPTWQRAVRSAIKKAPGTCLVITHSANLVPVETEDDLSALVRIENESGSSQIHRLSDGLSSDDKQRLVREFRLSTDAVSLLFARGVVLLEGETELGALPTWLDKIECTPECPSPVELDIAFYSVGGDTHFRTLLSVLHSFAIPWALVCDGAAFDVQKRDKRLPPHIRSSNRSLQILSPPRGMPQ